VAPTPPARTLQERLGNHAAQRFVARLQRKPTVSAPDDPLERQADVVADRVMRMSEEDVVQRVCKCEEEKKEQPHIQRVSSADSGAGLERERGRERGAAERRTAGSGRPFVFRAALRP
jgi:hypothetical protein